MSPPGAMPTATGAAIGLQCARHDSNMRPLPPQGTALSPELRALGGLAYPPTGRTPGCPGERYGVAGARDTLTLKRNRDLQCRRGLLPARRDRLLLPPAAPLG